jgi:error-prone DNA polymerase
MGYSLNGAGHHEWLAKTNFSFLNGASHPLEMLEEASYQRYRSLCINDFDGVYGLARAHLNLKEKIVDSRLKLHYGGELHLYQDHDRPLLLQQTVALVALNKIGYMNMCKIFSKSHIGSKKEAFLSTTDLENCNTRGIVAIKPMRGRIREGAGEQDLKNLKDIFHEGLYLGISRHLHPAEDAWIGESLNLSKKYELPTLLTQDAFFHSRERKNLNDLLHSIRTNLPMGSCDEHLFPNGERHLHSLNGLEFLFSKLPVYERSIRNSLYLAERIDFSFDELKYKYPGEMIPSGFSSQEFLEKIVIENMERRLGDDFNDNLQDKVWRELKLIRKLNFPDYFLTVWDIVRWARSQDILCQGRGSAANSIVCFALEITSIDPNQFELLLERFISEERADPPDIDVDFEHERREEVIQYIYERYGRKRAAMVANIITFRQKGAMRSVGKALGVPEFILKKASELQKMRLFRGASNDFLLLRLKKECEELELNLSWQAWIHFSSLIKGFPRHMGVHSGGFIVAGKDLDHLVPQEPATMEGRTVIQWSKDDIEGLGFFKIDILALGMLSAISKCFGYVKESYGKHYGLYDIPHDDKKTYAMIQRAETIGVFQIESRAQMTMLPRLKPKCFYDLVIEVAIIRPGPIQGKVIHPYLRRRDGIEAVTYPDPCLEPILKRTLGIAIFQEQAMRIAVEVGDFTGGEANELRRNIGAWNVRDFDQSLGPWMEKLKTGMKRKGFDDYFIEQILGQMKGFADYGFPESHAISFAFIAYASCYLKCHYPAAFFTSILNSQPMGFYSPHNLIQAAKHEGVEVLPPCVNHSDYDSKLEKQFGKNAIRMGLRLVNKISTSGAKALVLLRKKKGRWNSFDRFIKDTALYRDDLTALAAADAYKDFNLDRSNALWMSEAVPFKPMIDNIEKNIDWAIEGRMEKVTKDFASINTSLTDHPVKILREENWCYPLKLKDLTLSTGLQSIRENKNVNVFGMVRVKQSPPTAKGMVFITMEDETGFINLALHPYKYAAFFEIVEKEVFLCVNGELQMAGDYRSILVNFFYPLKEKLASVSPLQSKKSSTNEQAFVGSRQHY